MVRKLHRLIGLVLLLPFIGWAVTGVVFFTKPGYGAAYDALPIKTYPIEGPLAVRPDPAWQEDRYVRTILGLHLLVRTGKGGVAATDTGAVVRFDWNRLTLQQRGRDTDRIDRLYKIHYLQWTGNEGADKILGLTGLTLLIVLTALGARLAFRRN
jgi:hypothetical protein